MNTEPLPSTGGVGDDGVIARASGRAIVEQREVAVARDPRPPQVVVGRRGVRLEQIQQPPPVGLRFGRR